MRIERVRIEHFRCFSDQVVTLNPYTCFVGPNGAGKSTVLAALNLFFRETENVQTNLTSLDEEDFHQKDLSKPIRITVTFSNLSPEAKADFQDYVRQDKLIVTAEAKFDPATRRAEVRQYGQRLGMEAFRPFFEALPKAPAGELKAIFRDLSKKYPGIDSASTKDSMASALHNFEADHEKECVAIPSEDQFYGFSKGANRLGRHLQWVYVPAVKDATAEQLESKSTALGKLLARTVRQHVDFTEKIQGIRAAAQAEYLNLMSTQQDTLAELSQNLTRRVAEWSHPDATVKLEWHQDPERSVRVEDPIARMLVGDKEFEGNLARFGHGLQRSYLLALLHELASSDDSMAPTLILGCEEPELYQHPPQARHLAYILRQLSAGNAQVLISTHSPLFVSGEVFEDVRMVRKGAAPSGSSVGAVTLVEIAQAEARASGKPVLRPSGMLAKLHQALQPTISEMFFSSELVLVEGLEDVAFLTTGLHHFDLWNEFRRRGGQIVPTNGKSELLRPLLIAKQLSVPAFVLFDADTDSRADRWPQHEMENRALLTALDAETINPKPTTVLWGPNYAVWPKQFSETIADEIGRDIWNQKRAEADLHYSQAGNLGKNTLFIAFTLIKCFEAGGASPSLKRVCEAIVGRTGNQSSATAA